MLPICCKGEDAEGAAAGAAEDTMSLSPIPIGGGKVDPLDAVGADGSAKYWGPSSDSSLSAGTGPEPMLEKTLSRYWFILSPRAWTSWVVFTFPLSLSKL